MLRGHIEWTSSWEKDLTCMGVTPTTDDQISSQMLQQQDKEKINQVAARGLLNN